MLLTYPSIEIGLCEIPVNPVKYVQSTVCPKIQEQNAQNHREQRSYIKGKSDQIKIGGSSMLGWVGLKWAYF